MVSWGWVASQTLVRLRRRHDPGRDQTGQPMGAREAGKQRQNTLRQIPSSQQPPEASKCSHHCTSGTSIAPSCCFFPTFYFCSQLLSGAAVGPRHGTANNNTAHCSISRAFTSSHSSYPGVHLPAHPSAHGLTLSTLRLAFILQLILRPFFVSSPSSTIGDRTSLAEDME